MKKLANLKGVKTLNKNEQQNIKGMGIVFNNICWGLRCPEGSVCRNGLFCEIVDRNPL